jgi:hypothetical protein
LSKIAPMESSMKFEVYMVSGVVFWHEAHLQQRPNAKWYTLNNGWRAYYVGEATEDEIEEAAAKILADEADLSADSPGS